MEFNAQRSESDVNDAASPFRGLKVLVIDDSKTIRRTAETLLAKEGCEVYTAVDGFDALTKIADHQPDIVFVDIMMPRLATATRPVRSSSTTRCSARSR